MNGGPFLLTLACPVCGGDPLGGGASRVFLCPACRLAVVPEEGNRTFPALAFRPRIPGKRRVYLPFWRVTGRLVLEGAPPEKLAAWRRLKPFGAFFFPAFLTLRMGYYDDLTLRYGLLEEGFLEEDDGWRGPVADGVRLPRGLEEQARLASLAYLDRAADVTGLSARFEAERKAYALVPFFLEEEGWVDGLLGIRFPRGLLGAFEAPAFP